MKVMPFLNERLASYLDTPVKGLRFDWMTIEGRPIPEPAQASSLYHVVGAINAMQAYVDGWHLNRFGGQ